MYSYARHTTCWVLASARNLTVDRSDFLHDLNVRMLGHHLGDVCTVDRAGRVDLLVLLDSNIELHLLLVSGAIVVDCHRLAELGIDVLQ